MSGLLRRTATLKRIPPVIYMLGVAMLAFSFTANNFISLGNAFNVMKQASPLLVLAIGETMAILVGGIDLSVGYLMSFTGLMAAFMLRAGFPLPAVLALAIAIAAAIGMLNGVLVTKFKLPYFIATFGIGYVLFGAGLLLSGGMSVPALNAPFRFIADGDLLGIPMIIICAAAIFLGLTYRMKYTPFGRNVYSLGGNREALYLSGINVDWAEIKVFTTVGLLAGCAGIMFSSRAASGHPSSGMSWEFDAVASTIIGGNSFSEGRGSINKTILGVAFISILRNGLNMSGVTPQIQSFLVGVIVVIAISVDVLSKKK